MKIKVKERSAIGRYIRSTSDILLKGKDIRNSYIPPNWNDMRSIADITKLCAMPCSKIIECQPLMICYLLRTQREIWK
jgi:hypothetical protein